MAGSSLYLADSNILLRLVKVDHPEFPLVRGAIRALLQKGMTPAYTLQNMTEFWNASTRSKERNGFGLTVEETERNAQDIEDSFTLLVDTEAVYREWRRIVVQYNVSAVQVHDARLAAAMYAHGISDPRQNTGGFEGTDAQPLGRGARKIMSQKKERLSEPCGPTCLKKYRP